MGVLIKDMKMPKGFEMLVVFSDGTAHKCLPGMREHVEKGTAVPVPPHGRLIDADALYKEALKRSETKDGYYNCLDPVISCYTIDHAPTIIPAEEGET